LLIADDYIHDKKNDEQNGARTESFSQEFFSVEFQSGHFKLQIFLQTNNGKYSQKGATKRNSPPT